MIEKYKLNLLVAFIILLPIIWLIRAGMVWDWVGLLLLLGVAVLVVWTLLLREKKQARLLEFFLRSLVVSYAVTSVIWFVWLGVRSLQIYVDLNFEGLMNMLVLSVFVLSLLPVAISVILYGLFRIRLRAWEMFLPSWYVSVFAVFTIGARPAASQYSSIAGGLGEFFGQVFLSLFIAIILTVVYVSVRARYPIDS
jgi:hypothetical protein